MGWTRPSMDKVKSLTTKKSKRDDVIKQEFSLPRLKTSDQFRVAFTRSDTEFLTVAVKKRTSQKVVSVWQTRANAKEAGRRRNYYTKLCQKIKVIPVRRVMGQIGGSRMSVRNFYLGGKEIRAVCKTVRGDGILGTLDLSGNMLSSREGRYVQEVLIYTSKLTTLALDECGLGSETLDGLSRCPGIRQLHHLSLAGNRIQDKDSGSIAYIIQNCKALKHFNLSHNTFETEGCKILGQAIEENTNIKELDLSWNHIRGRGSIYISRGIQHNTCITDVNLAWNGFGFEGCSAMSEALRQNTTLTRLNMACNRVHPPAMLELTRGLCMNKCLLVLDLSNNPITPIYTTILINAIKKCPEMSLQLLRLEKIVVDKPFVDTLTELKQQRGFDAVYELALPVKSISEDKMRKEIQAPSVFNMDPLKLLYMLKEKNRAQDFFRRINKDNDDSVSPEEIKQLFKESGVPVSDMVIEKIVNFLDEDGDGHIDMREFLAGDKKMRKMSRDTRKTGDEDMNKYSRSFRKGNIDPMTFRLKVSNAPNLLSPVMSRESSPNGQRKLSS
ncbi:leucine-rich repeat-containing protein 74B-like [Ylistrum balloti]|uniref:leucine-rich repeat-containing protein 74B-like n=1 Tax=Ylistrum balloti TaxID=509963 RepID=UPI00290589E3|nr:leucine-rich repeat-containing protein 74B-like [Ylistrum balloti]